MNSEELERSLRTEFESYLKDVVAGMRQDVSEFQKMVETEFEKHKSQMDDAFRSFQERFATEKELDVAFTETVVEHLRLARDEGARITATAFAEAEELQKEEAAATDSSHVVSEIRDAIRDISSKSTQSAILKSLVAHASNFTPRGAFFIIKNEHLVGWRVFGTEANSDDRTVREVFFPVGSDTLPGESVRELKTVEAAFGTYADDSVFLNRLEFGKPDRMYAIPLIVRERAVAVLYADYGNEGSNVNVEALEALVQVAGLTVEISASARSAKAHHESELHDESEYSRSIGDVAPAASINGFESTDTNLGSSYSFTEPVISGARENARDESFPTTETFDEDRYLMRKTVDEGVTSEPETVEEDTYSMRETVEEESSSAPETVEEESYSMRETSGSYEFATAPEEVASAEFDRAEPMSSFDFVPTEDFPAASEFEQASEWSETVSVPDDYATPKFESAEFESFQPQKFESEPEPAEFSAPAVGEYEFESVPSASNVEFESTAPVFEPATFETAQSFDVENFNAGTTPVAEVVPEPIVEVVPEPVVAAPANVRTRLSERNVDLPIEVSEDERRLHNDARRFARLLVSEIKLYNEQKVKEGREANDLYEKLKEAIDRSREMYDKRVQPPVAAKFDYFHYELVSNLAEGDEGKLGSSYVGTTI